MNRDLYPRDDTQQNPGTWKPLGVYGHPEQVTATIKCKGCGSLGALDRHHIALGGDVIESVLCACGYHEHITLLDWAQHLSKRGG